MISDVVFFFNIGFLSRYEFGVSGRLEGDEGVISCLWKVFRGPYSHVTSQSFSLQRSLVCLFWDYTRKLDLLSGNIPIKRIWRNCSKIMFRLRPCPPRSILQSHSITVDVLTSSHVAP